MMLYDQKDIDIIADVIDKIAPVNIDQRARLIVAAARQAFVSLEALERAIKWWDETYV